LGKLIQENQELTKEELLNIIQNPTYANKCKLMDLIMASLKKYNNLPDNDPHFLELMNLVYAEKTQDIFHSKNNAFDSKPLANAALKIKKEGFSLEDSKEHIEVDQIDPLNPPNLESFESSINPNAINECLLALVTENDLSDLGITESFVNALKEFTSIKQKLTEEIEREHKNYQIVTGQIHGKLDGYIDESKVNQIQGYFPSNLSLVERRDKSNLLFEQLAMTEINLRERRRVKGKPVDYLDGHLVKQRVYRVHPEEGIISKEEFMLTNDNVYNIEEKDEDEEEELDERSILFK
jgi:hypothetical protein